MSMIFDNESERMLRRARSALAVSGRGILCLTIWNILKTALSFLYSSNWEDVRNIVFTGTRLDRIIYIIVALVMLFIYGYLYFYIAFGAIKEGYGRQKNSRYLVVAAILSLLLFVETLTVFFLWMSGNSDFMHLTQIPVDLITLAALTDLLINGLRVRRYVRQNHGEGC